jgi:hypothetical protein
VNSTVNGMPPLVVQQTIRSRNGLRIAAIA